MSKKAVATETRLGREVKASTPLNQSVRKAIALLRAAGSSPDGETASSLARLAELPWATTVRLIRTLEHEGFLSRLPDDRYVTGFELVRLGRAADHESVLAALAHPVLERLADRVEETVSLVVVRGAERFEVIDQIDPPRFIGSTTWATQVYPLHASAIGKVLLSTYDDDALAAYLAAPLESYTPATVTEPGALRAEIERIRAKGWSSNVDELEEGLSALSVGVYGADRALLGQVTISGPSFRFEESSRAAAVEPLRQGGAEIERLLLRT
jgi:IclR family transcriptional regulator, acetate operon repressor